MTSPLAMDDLRILDICRDVELLNEQLYRRFARLFADNMELAELWKKTANEEANHAQQFDFAIRMKKDMLERIIVDAKEVVSVHKFVSNAIAMADSNPPDPEEALHLAINLEKRLADMHLGCISVFTDESHKKLFRSMMAFDNRHLELLVEVKDRYSKAR